MSYYQDQIIERADGTLYRVVRDGTYMFVLVPQETPLYYVSPQQLRAEGAIT